MTSKIMIFGLGMAAGTLLMVAALISPFGIAGRYYTAIAECEQDLPHNTQCKMAAIPIQKETRR